MSDYDKSYHSDEEHYSTDHSIYDPTKDEDAASEEDEEEEEESLGVKRPLKVKEKIVTKRPYVRKERNVISSEIEQLHSEETFKEAFEECLENSRQSYGQLVSAFNAKDTSVYLEYSKGDKKGFVQMPSYISNVLKEICLILTNVLFISNPESVPNIDQTEWLSMQLTRVIMLSFLLLSHLSHFYICIIIIACLSRVTKGKSITRSTRKRNKTV